MKIANEAGFAIKVDADEIDQNLTKGLKNLKDLKKWAKLGQRKSIMSLAAPGFYFYPLIASASIDPEYMMSIAKGFQMTYASSVATAYSLNSAFDRSVYPQAGDYVRSFHQNDTKILNANIVAAATSLGVNISQDSFVYTEDDEDKIAIEARIADGEYCGDDLLAINLIGWEDPRDQLVMESLNDMYQPYKRTIRILEKRLNMSKATEGKVGDALKNIYDQASNALPRDNPATGIHPREDVTTKRAVRDQNGRVVTDNYGRTVYEDEVRRTKPQPVMPNFRNEIVRNNNLEAMEPTMVQVQVVAYGGKDADGKSSQSVHNITLSIKCMPRILGSNLMIASLIEACEESHGIFKFLKWTKGEIKTLDTILGISSSKKKALQKNAKNEVRLLEQSRKRKKINGVGRFVKNEVLPTTTIVITTYEAEKVKEATGVDLTNLLQAMKLMNKYYLLAFGIYDTEQNTMKVLFDCDSDWGYTTIGSLKSAVNKTNDVLNQNEVLRLFGRR